MLISQPHGVHGFIESFSGRLACFTVLGLHSVGITLMLSSGSRTCKTPVWSDGRPHLFSFGFPPTLLPALPATLPRHSDLNVSATLPALVAHMLAATIRALSAHSCLFPLLSFFWSARERKTDQGHTWALVVDVDWSVEGWGSGGLRQLKGKCCLCWETQTESIRLVDKGKRSWMQWGAE